jgi:hypothetical protein
VRLLLGGLLGTRAAEQDVEGDGVRLLAALLRHDVTRLLTLRDQLEALEATAGPVEQTAGSAGGDLGLGTTVLLDTEALAETAIAGTGAEVEGAEDGGATDVVPVVVLGSALSAVGGLDDLGAAGNEQLALLLEVAGERLHEAPAVDVTDGRTLALADALVLLSGGHHC